MNKERSRPRVEPDTPAVPLDAKLHLRNNLRGGGMPPARSTLTARDTVSLAAAEPTADVAEELLRGPVVSERDAAIRTADDMSALRTLEGARPAASIEEEDGLFFSFETLGDGFLELI